MADVDPVLTVALTAHHKPTTTMFSISFRKHHDNDPAHGSHNAIGDITIGDFKERFTSLTTHWSQEQYKEQWRIALQRLLDGHPTSVFVTSVVRGPDITAVHWPAYRIGESVIFQNHLLLRSVSAVFDTRNMFDHIPTYHATNEDGEQISSWSIPFISLA